MRRISTRRPSRAANCSATPSHVLVIPGLVRVSLILTLRARHSGMHGLEIVGEHHRKSRESIATAVCARPTLDRRMRHTVGLRDSARQICAVGHLVSATRRSVPRLHRRHRDQYARTAKLKPPLWYQSRADRDDVHALAAEASATCAIETATGDRASPRSLPTTPSARVPRRHLGVQPASSIVLREWQEPTHEEWGGLTDRRLFNAATFALADG